MAARKRPKQARRPERPRGAIREQRLIDAAMTLAAEQGWRRLGMAEIANSAGVSLKDAYGLVRSKHGILAALRRGADEAMLAGGVVTGDSPRDRLFEALMRRFEALRPYRVGFAGRVAGQHRQPRRHRLPARTAALDGLDPDRCRLPASGCRGHLARRLVGCHLCLYLPTFFRDEGSDLGTTMAALDKRLRQVETVLSSLGPILGGRRSRA